MTATKEGMIAVLAREGEEAYRTKDAQKFADWLIPNVLLVLGALKLLAEMDANDQCAWIACDKKLPEQEGRYAVLYSHPGRKALTPYIGDYDPVDGRWRCGLRDERITHWMALPDPNTFHAEGNAP